MRILKKICNAKFISRENIENITKIASVSVANQIVSSGANLLLNIYLVRALTLNEFGIFGIGFSSILFFSGIGNALFLTQMVVNFPGKMQHDRLPYATRILIAMLIFFSLIALILISTLILFSKFYLSLDAYFELTVSLLAASLFYLIKDFFVRLAYTKRKEFQALIVNSSMAFSLIAFYLLSKTYSIDATATVAFLAIAVANFFGVIVGLFIAKLPFSGITCRKTIDDWKEAWRGGMWAVGGGIVIWGQSQAYIYLTAAIAGPAAVGIANAAKLLTMPAIFLFTAINQLLTPRLAELRIKNEAKMLKASDAIGILFSAIAVIYSVLILSTNSWLTKIIIGDTHQNSTPLLAAWCFVLIFQFSRTGSSIALQVVKEFRIIMIDNLFSAIIAIMTSLILLNFLGVTGAIIGTAIGEFALSILLYKSVLKLKNRLNQIS